MRRSRPNICMINHKGDQGRGCMRPSKGQCAVAGSNAWEWTTRADLSPCTVLQCPPAQCSVPLHSAQCSSVPPRFVFKGRKDSRPWIQCVTCLSHSDLCISSSCLFLLLDLCFIKHLFFFLRPINFICLSSITHEPVNGERDGGDSSSVILLPLRLIRLTLSDCWKECLN